MMTNELAELKPLRLKPFERQLKSCAKCGYRGLIRLPGWIIRWLDLPYAHFKVHYCPGGQEPQKTFPTLLGPEVNINMPCAGMTEDHLHCQCGHCGYAFLMETADGL